MNKKMLAVPLVLLALGCRDRYEGQAGAASTPSPSPYAESGGYASPGTMSGSAGDAGTITATVVSVDPSGSSITLRESGAADGSQGRRLNVASSAATSLSGIQPGETVSVTCETMGGTGAIGGTGTGTTGTTGTGTTGTGTGTTGTGAGTTGTGTAGSTGGYLGTGSLANCTTVTMVTRSAGAAGR